MISKGQSLREQALQHINPKLADSLHTRATKEKRLERFVNNYLLKVALKCRIYPESLGKYILETDKGIVEFYPKSNKLYFIKTKESIGGGLNWIIKNILTEKTQ